MFSNFLGQPVSQQRHAEFRDEISDFSWNDFEIDRRRHIDDVAPLALDHVRKHGSGCQEGGSSIDGHDQVESFRRSLHNRLPPQGAGIVDQDVDTSEALDRPSHHRVDLIAVADVNLNR